MHNPLSSRHAPPLRTLKMNARESALLLNLLSDNARVWNASLRIQLHQQVSAIEAYNAKVDMKEGRV